MLFILGFSETLSGQQDAQYTQYMYNTMVINPAYAGSRGVLSGLLLHRSQWVGIEGAPTTQNLNIHSPVGKNVGLGLSIIKDDIGNGTVSETAIDLSFSYTLKVFDESKLSFGLKASANLLNIDLSSLEGYLNEPIRDVAIDRKFFPNFGGGVYYHTSSFYVGVSVPNFLQTKYFNDSDSENFVLQERINIYVMAGKVLDLSATWKFKPALLFKVVSGAPLQADMSTNFIFNEKLSLGVAYRYKAAFSGKVGFQMSDQFMIGLAYDRETSALGDATFNDGSFEVFLRYELFSQSKRLVTPRFF